jgi:hypothetical protein
VLSWWAPAVLATPAFGSEDPLAPVDRGSWYHQDLTTAAAVAEGWGAGAAAELGRHTFGVDLYAYHAVWVVSGGRSRRRGAGLARAPLLNVHFDNLASTAEIAEIWRRVNGGAVAGIQWAAQQNDPRAARQVIGVGLHAIQDFYSHSTWIDAPARRGHTWLEHGPALDPGLSTGGYGPDADTLPHRHGDTRATATGWFRVLLTPLTPLDDLLRSSALRRLRTLLASACARVGVGARGRAGLVRRTRPGFVQPAGTPDHPRPPRGLREPEPAGINLDSRWEARAGVRGRHLTDLDGDTAFDLAIALAGRESRTWLSRLDRRFAADPATTAFWSQVRGGPGLDWTAAFNDPAVRGYDFIAAGRYPPRGHQDAARWFHRVLVTAAPDRPRPVRATAQLRTLDARGLQLRSVPLPIGRAVTVGPVPAGAAVLELTAPIPGRAQVHAFRRAPEPELRLVIDRSLDAADRPFRVPIEHSDGTAAPDSPERPRPDPA